MLDTNDAAPVKVAHSLMLKPKTVLDETLERFAEEIPIRPTPELVELLSVRMTGDILADGLALLAYPPAPVNPLYGRQAARCRPEARPNP